MGGCSIFGEDCGAGGLIFGFGGIKGCGGCDDFGLPYDFGSIAGGDYTSGHGFGGGSGGSNPPCGFANEVCRFDEAAHCVGVDGIVHSFIFHFMRL